MKILAVDNIRRRLTELEKTLKVIFPDAAVTSFVDPMLAAKYGVQHNVDIIIAERTMRRIDGLEMAGLVHKFNKNIRVFLIREKDKALDGINDSDVDGWLERPNIEERLRGITSNDDAGYLRRSGSG